VAVVYGVQEKLKPPRKKEGSGVLHCGILDTLQKFWTEK
jgi:hypothetical protein